MNKVGIQAVNAAVNGPTVYAIPPDYKWSNSDENIIDGKPTGMCADQAIAKWERLLALDVSLDDTRFAEVKVEPLPDPNANREHAILCVRDDDGLWWALDIRHPYLMEPAMLPYEWRHWRRSFAEPWRLIEWS